MSKPRMIFTVPEDMSGAPPFMFQGVTTRVFPLKAHFNQLSLFCSNYLNLAPDVAVFRPALPMVFLGMINYGKMEPEAFSAGWVAQNEVFFGIPLEWYRVENGRLIFHDWAVVCPFIFVDSDASLLTGREVFGWPKVKAWLDPRIHTWTHHPRSRRTLLTLSTQVFPKIYAGQRQAPRVLVEIEQEPMVSPLSLPQRENPLLSSLKDLQSLAFSFADMTSEYLGGFLRLPQEMRTLATGPSDDLVARIKRLMAMVTPGSTLHTINLKQMRDSEQPEMACYQSVNATQMRVRNIHGGGILGDIQVLLGDLSGGYRVRIHEYDAQPIVDSLGLECFERREEGDSPVSVFRPTLPFWIDLDLEYGLGENLFSSAKTDPGWPASGTTKGSQAKTNAEAKTNTGAKTASARPISRPPSLPTAPRDSRYKTARGGATEALIAPFSFPNATVFVFPMLADTRKLQLYCTDLNNQFNQIEGRHQRLRIKPFSYVPHLGTQRFSYVYMTVTNFGEMSAPKNDVGWWADREVAFFVPVRVFLDDELVTQGMLVPYVFMDNGLAVISSREVNGWPTGFADIRAPEDLLMSADGPTTDRLLLRLDTEVTPALHMRQKFENKTLLEILEGDVALSRRDEDKNELNQWSDRLLADLDAKTIAWRRYNYLAHEDDVGQALFVPPSLFASGHLAFNVLAFKQMKELDDMMGACFQAFTSTPRRIQRVHEVREIDEQIHIRIHRYPTHPIVDRLGLFVKTTEVGKNPQPGRSWSGATVANIEPIRPFWMRLAWEAEVPRDLLWRADSQVWQGADRLSEESEKFQDESLYGRFVQRASKDSYLPLSQLLIETALWDYEQRGKDSVWHQYWSWDFNLDSLSGIALSEDRIYEDFPPFWVRRDSLSKKSLAAFFAKVPEAFLNEDRIPEEFLDEDRIHSRDIYQKDLTGLPRVIVRYYTEALPEPLRSVVGEILDEISQQGLAPEHVIQRLRTISSSADEERLLKYFMQEVDIREMRVFLEYFVIHLYARMNQMSEEDALDESIELDDTFDGLD